MFEAVSIIFLPLLINCLLVRFNQESLELNTGLRTINALFRTSLRIHDNYPIMGQFLHSCGLRLSSAFELQCYWWDRPTYEAVRAFVVQDRDYEEYLLSPRCMRHLTFITHEDLERNFDDALFASIPEYPSADELDRFTHVLANIDFFDRKGYFKSHMASAAFQQWSLYKDDVKILLDLPLHKFIHYSMGDGFSSEWEFSTLLGEYLDRNRGDEQIEASIMIVVLERHFRLQFRGLFELSAITYWHIFDRFKDGSRKLDSMVRLLWNPYSFIPIELYGDESFEVGKLAILVSLMKNMPLTRTITDLISNHLTHIDDYQLVELLRLITEYDRSGREICAVILESSPNRLFTIRPELFHAKPFAFNCFTPTERILYFRRWERLMPLDRVQPKGSEPYLLLMSIPMNNFTEGYFKGQLVNLLRATTGIIVSFSCTDQLINYLAPTKTGTRALEKIDQVAKLIMTVLALKLHYNGSMYEIAPEWAYSLACLRPMTILDLNLKDIPNIVPGIKIAYNLICLVY